MALAPVNACCFNVGGPTFKTTPRSGLERAGEAGRGSVLGPNRPPWKVLYLDIYSEPSETSSFVQVEIEELEGNVADSNNDSKGATFIQR